MAPPEVERLIRLPENEWTTTPKKVMAYAEFMSRTGLMTTKPAPGRSCFSSISTAKQEAEVRTPRTPSWPAQRRAFRASP
jgi:hypothetical protein